ncbi:MAG: hypothetical protein M1321_02905 [Candidatus Marsarchaeota archaeon]|nr:hypothetical protein [Candidatus Marsarchaeota archaeon]
MSTNFDEIKRKVKELNLPMGKYAIFGSVPLAVHGIRETNDIDIIVTPELYARFEATGEWKEETLSDGGKKLVKDSFEVMKTWWSSDSYRRDVTKLIADAEMIDGVPVVRLEELLAWKKAFGREKDIMDVKLIEEYLIKQGGSTEST